MRRRTRCCRRRSHRNSCATVRQMQCHRFFFFFSGSGSAPKFEHTHTQEKKRKVSPHTRCARCVCVFNLPISAGRSVSLHQIVNTARGNHRSVFRCRRRSFGQDKASNCGHFKEKLLRLLGVASRELLSNSNSNYNSIAAACCCCSWRPLSKQQASQSSHWNDMRCTLFALASTAAQLFRFAAAAADKRLPPNGSSTNNNM